MSHAEPDYKLLYEQSQQQLVETEQQLSETKQQLVLALNEINELRAKLFGIKADNRVKKAAGGEIDSLPLGATPAEVATSEALLKEELEQGLQKTVEKRAKAPTTRMVLPAHLEREEVIIDPAGDLNNYHIIGEEITEVLMSDRPGP